MIHPALYFGQCKDCGRWLAAREDGTMRVHRPAKRPGRQDPCKGSLESPRGWCDTRPTERAFQEASRMIGGCG